MNKVNGSTKQMYKQNNRKKTKEINKNKNRE